METALQGTVTELRGGHSHWHTAYSPHLPQLPSEVARIDLIWSTQDSNPQAKSHVAPGKAEKMWLQLLWMWAPGLFYSFNISFFLSSHYSILRPEQQCEKAALLAGMRQRQQPQEGGWWPFGKSTSGQAPIFISDVYAHLLPQKRFRRNRQIFMQLTNVFLPLYICVWWEVIQTHDNLTL